DGPSRGQESAGGPARPRFAVLDGRGAPSPGAPDAAASVSRRPDALLRRADRGRGAERDAGVARGRALRDDRHLQEGHAASDPARGGRGRRHRAGGTGGTPAPPYGGGPAAGDLTDPAAGLRIMESRSSLPE